MSYDKLYFYKERNNNKVLKEVQWKSISDTNNKDKEKCLDKLISNEYVVVSMAVPKYFITSKVKED